MTQDDWRIAVTREMKADLWYERPDHDEILMITRPEDAGILTANGNGNSPKVSVAAG
jgi:hypothetical protein